MDKENEGREDVNFWTGFTAVAKEAHATAVAKGWWDGDRSTGDIFANLHGEVSEAWEAYREGNPPSKKAEGFSSIEEELADLVIRLMDYAIQQGFDVPAAILVKMEYNRSRPYRHGGKLA